MVRATSEIARGSDPARTGRRSQRRACLLFVLFWTCLFLAGPAKASGGLEIQAWVDKTEATLEDQIFLTVSISGQRRVPSGLELPSLPDFSIAKGGTSSRTEIVNGSIRTSVEVTYLLTPRHVGIFTIPPVRLKHKGRTYQSQPLRVKVLPAASPTAARPKAFVTQEVDAKKPFVHQQIVYTFRFFRRVQSVEAQWDPPSFQGFWVEDLGKERQYEKVLNGQRYAVTELKKALYPLSEGPASIEECLLTCQLVVPRQGALRGMDSFFGSAFFGSRAQTITKNLRGEPISLDIRSLPDAGRPEGFQGLVGSFVVQAEIGQDRLRLGDSTTLTVTVRGTGNLRDLVALLPEEIPGFKIYPDKPNFQAQIQGDTLHSTKVFKKALVPLKAGVLEIPPQEVPYFDPEEGAYRIARTAPIALTVEEDGEKEHLHLVTASDLAGSKSSIKILGKDILPIHTGLAGARSQIPSGTSLYATLAGLLLPPCIFLVCYGKKRRQERLEADQHIVRRKGARKKANRLLKEAGRRIRRPEDKEYFGQLARALKGLVGDKLDRNTLACTPAEIERCLLEKGLPQADAREAREFLEELEYDLYVSQRLEADERAALHKRARRLLSRLDKHL